MLDNSYCDEKVSVSEDTIELSDGVGLKIFDFRPASDGEDKPVILFVAGWVSLITGWKSVLKILTAEYRTLYLETREKRSAFLPKNKAVDFSIERMSKDLEETIQQKIGEKRPFYMSGSSLGSTVILDYMSRDVRQPDLSLLISPICEFPFPPWLIFIIRFVPANFYTLVRPILKGYLKYFRLDSKKEPEQVKKYEGTIDAAEPVRLKANAYAIKDYSLWDKLSGIQAPVVIIGAETDKLHETDITKRMVELIPNAGVHFMESNRETHSGQAGEFIVEQIREREENRSRRNQISA